MQGFAIFCRIYFSILHFFFRTVTVALSPVVGATPKNGPFSAVKRTVFRRIETVFPLAVQPSGRCGAGGSGNRPCPMEATDTPAGDRECLPASRQFELRTAAPAVWCAGMRVPGGRCAFAARSPRTQRRRLAGRRPGPCSATAPRMIWVSGIAVRNCIFRQKAIYCFKYTEYMFHGAYPTIV